ncbi:MAG TPA: thioredoxin domain-containing protein [Allosphingosinicella sp.]|jgi:protein-disulfide isomerase
MKTMSGVSALALALLLGACTGGASNTVDAAKGPESLQRIAAPNNANWADTVVETQEGYLMGNPNAPVKLVEYASITCPHCAEFSRQAGERLRQYVQTGQVSWEYRPFMIFPTDPGVFMLLRCQGAQSFFAVSDQLYRDQEQWMGRVRAVPEAQLQQTEQMAPTQRAAFLTQAAGLDQFFRQRGMPEAQVGQCLANQAELQRLAAISARATAEERVQGTPTFIINGELVEGADSWQELEPALQARLGG